jgi:hypothetical protein
MAPSNLPQGLIIQPVKGGQIRLKFGRYILPTGRAANLHRMEQYICHSLLRGLRYLLKPQIKMFR